MSAKERSFERRAEDVKGLMGFFSDKAGRSHLLPLEPLFQGSVCLLRCPPYSEGLPCSYSVLREAAFARPALIMIHTSTASHTSPAQRVEREMGQDLDRN